MSAIEEKKDDKRIELKFAEPIENIDCSSAKQTPVRERDYSIEEEMKIPNSLQDRQAEAQSKQKLSLTDNENRFNKSS